MNAAPPDPRPAPPPVPALVWASSLGLAVVALVCAGRVDGVPRAIFFAFAFVAIVRVSVGAGGRSLLPSRALLALRIAGIAAGTAWIFHELGTGPALSGLLFLSAAMQAYLLVPRQTTFTVFLQVMFSSATAVGAAFLLKDAAALWLSVAYVLCLAWTLVLYERGVALATVASTKGSVHRLRAEGSEALPVRPLLGTVARFVALGFPLGLLVYLGVPRTWDWLDAPGEDVARRAEERTADGGRGTRDPISAVSGPVLKATSDTVSVAFGTVAEVKRNLTPYFEVREVGRSEPPQHVILRETVLEHFDRDTHQWTMLAPRRPDRWYASNARGTLDLGGRDHRARGRTLETRYLQPVQRFFLEPVAVSLQVRRSGLRMRPFRVRRRADELWEPAFELRVNDVTAQRSVPALYPDDELEGRRSDRAVSPKTSYLVVPPDMAAGLRDIALKVVGKERDPWRRARRLEAWLKSEAFEYRLRPPPVDPRRPVIDFLTRVRSGHCELYASSICLLLRSLGHPTRWARGFWGGDATQERGSVIMSGTHYHAWGEMFLHGIGWVPLNPTPPDRRAADADTLTVESQQREERGSSFSFLGLNEENWTSFWAGVGNFLRRWLLDPLGALFGKAPLLFLALLGVLVGWAIVRQTRGRTSERGGGARTRAVSLGVYGEALRLLSRKGTRRRRNQTLREFESYAAARHPDAASSFATLTTLRERERYAGGSTSGSDAAQALERLAAALSSA